MRAPLVIAVCLLAACSASPGRRAALPVPRVDRQIERAGVVEGQIRRSLVSASGAQGAIRGAQRSILDGNYKEALVRLKVAQGHIDALTEKLLSAGQESGALRAELQQVKPRLAAVAADYANVVVERNDLKSENSGLKSFKTSMHAWGGLGAIWWGIKHLFLRVLLSLAGIGAIWAALAFFFPPAAALGFRFLGLFIPRFRTP